MRLTPASSSRRPNLIRAFFADALGETGLVPARVRKMENVNRRFYRLRRNEEMPDILAASLLASDPSVAGRFRIEPAGHAGQGGLVTVRIVLPQSAEPKTPLRTRIYAAHPVD
jgi:hypothetical protein